MKNSSDPNGNRTRDLPTCSAVPQPTAPPRTPHNVGSKSNNSNKLMVIMVVMMMMMIIIIIIIIINLFSEFRGCSINC